MEVNYGVLVIGLGNENKSDPTTIIWKLIMGPYSWGWVAKTSRTLQYSCASSGVLMIGMGK